MTEALKKLFLNSKNIERDSYVWNTAQSLLISTQSAILLMVISRTNGIDDAGVFSIAYAVASLIYYIGEFGVRKYQITDVNEKASFGDYHTHRLITCLIAAAAGIIYASGGLISGRYIASKFWVIVIVCVMKVIEAYCDVYFARFQQQGRLDVAAKASTYRLLIPMILCMASLIITHDLLLSMLVWLAVTVFSVLTSFILVAPEFGRIEVCFNKSSLLLITRECLPLFAGSFFLLYVGNAPKYAIDACLDDRSQACFNYIFMPVFVIGMLANFIFNPILVKLAHRWNEKDYEAFGKIVYRQIAVIGGITLLAIAVALTIGCPVLGLLFNTDLSGSRLSLTVLMVGGGMLALANFFIVVVTVVRGQKYLMPGYIGSAILAALFSKHFVLAYGVPGASCLYTALMTAVAVMFAIVLVLCVNRAKGKDSETSNS